MRCATNKRDIMDNNEVLEIFQKTDALLKGHFKLSSGLHSGQYLQCALVLQHPQYAQLLCRQLAQEFAEEKPTAIVAPALGGVLVSYEVARSLGCRSLFTEREEGKMVLRRGFGLGSSDRVVVVEDVVTTGASTREVIDVVTQAGARLIGVGAIVDRSGETIDFGVPFKSLLALNIKAFKPEECPLCKRGIPIVKPGSRPT